MSTGAPGVQKRAPDLLELELQEAGSSLAWLLGTECGSSAGTVHAPNPVPSSLPLSLLLLLLFRIVCLPALISFVKSQLCVSQREVALCDLLEDCRFRLMIQYAQ